MVHRFGALVIEDACIRILQTMAEPSIRRPASAVHDQPKEEFNLRWRRCFPYVLSSKGDDDPINIAPYADAAE